MKCPSCFSRQHVEISLHADGFAQDIRECGDCGALWTYSGCTLKMIKTPATAKDQSDQNFSAFCCPTCKSALCIETNLDSFQFHEQIFECTNCGTICCLAHAQLEVVTDSQEHSFLSATTALVEADDYAFI